MYVSMYEHRHCTRGIVRAAMDNIRNKKKAQKTMSMLN